MKKNNVKIKNNITMVDKISAIDSIVDACFTYDENKKTTKYTPYYKNIANVVAIVLNFIEGLEFEKNENIYDIAMSDDEVNSLVNKFFFNIEETSEAVEENKENQTYILLFDEIQHNVDTIVKFEKEKLIHKNDKLEEYIERKLDMFESFKDFFVEMTKSFKTLSNLNLTALTPETIEFGKKIMTQLKDKDITIDTVSDVIKNAVNFDMDQASADIIDAKNKKIKELEKENLKLNLKLGSQNVLADKGKQ